jgi:hypothetical protein
LKQEFWTLDSTGELGREPYEPWKGSKNKNEPGETENMSNKFDELTKSMAQSVTRRAALKKFGVGLAGMALACFGLANKAEATPRCAKYGRPCATYSDCCSGICLPDGSCGCSSEKDCGGKSAIFCSPGGLCLPWI